MNEQPIHTDADALAPLLVEKTAGFCRVLRGAGFTIGVPESLDAARIAGRFLVPDFPAFRHGLRGLCASSPKSWQAFDALFDAYWLPGAATPDAGPPPRPGHSQDSGSPGALRLAGYAETDRDAEQEDSAPSGAAAAEVLRHTDLSHVPREDMAELERLALRLWRRMSLRLARRLRGRELTTQIDLRRTLRRNISRGGHPAELVFKGRKRRKPGLVLLLDVSGSMSQYSFFFLRLMYVLQRHFRHVASFLFSTGLVEISPLLAGNDLPRALDSLSTISLGWGGGTRIGESLAQLNREHGERVLRANPFVIVLSDGWDVGEPDLLYEELRTLRRRARKLIWLNPLLGIEGYEPLTRGMRAALPVIDVFAPAHNLQSLLDIERILVG